MSNIIRSISKPFQQQSKLEFIIISKTIISINTKNVSYRVNIAFNHVKDIIGGFLYCI